MIKVIIERKIAQGMESTYDATIKSTLRAILEAPGYMSGANFKDAEDEIPAKYWIKTTDETKAELKKFSRDIRLALKEEGKMDPKALKLLWKIRCASDQSASECSTPE